MMTPTHLQQVADMPDDELGQLAVCSVHFGGQVADAAGQALHHGAADALFGIGDGKGRRRRQASIKACLFRAQGTPVRADGRS
ncbi:hypothetical protein ACQEVF_30895 [Nonomuraea polychroma]|uniref:hypothetical protein n=1 Tax=Nonomuraea polychroma TaxID=46176 RepID=UPI003D937D3C